MRACLLYTISFSIYFPIKGSGRYPKCREFKCFQIFVPSFPSFGNGFDSRRPLQILKKLGDNLDKVSRYQDRSSQGYSCGFNADWQLIRLGLDLLPARHVFWEGCYRSRVLEWPNRSESRELLE
jgi:hypothetical protein